MIKIETMRDAIVRRVSLAGFSIIKAEIKYQEEHDMESIELIGFKDGYEVQAGFLYQPIPCYFDTPKIFTESMEDYIKGKAIV